MKEITVKFMMHMRNSEERKAIRIRECEMMIDGLMHNAIVIKRYLRRFLDYLSVDEIDIHLTRYERLTSQAAEQRRKLARLLYKAPVQLQIDNC